MGRAAGKASSPSSAETKAQDDWSSLLHHHIAKIRPLQSVHAQSVLVTKSHADNVTDAMGHATTDLRVTRKWLEHRILLAGMSLRDVIAERELNEKADNAQGFAIQMDMFGATDTERDANYWQMQGYSHGVNGLDQDPPKGMHSMFLANYSTGYNDGQALLIMRMGHAKVIVEKAANPSTGGAVDMSGGGEVEEELDDHERAAAEAEKLKASGFMDTSGGEGGDEGGTTEGTVAPEPGIAGVALGSEGAPSADAQAEIDRIAATATPIEAATETFVESTPEELDGQQGRAEIQAQRAEAIGRVH